MPRLSTERYLREVTLPALERGRAKAGRTMAGFEISGPGFIATGNDEREIAAAVAAVRQQISFYGSTPAYRKVLELHGWGALGDELNRRYGDLVHRMTLTVPYQRDPDRWAAFFDAVRVTNSGL